MPAPPPHPPAHAAPVLVLCCGAGLVTFAAAQQAEESLNAWAGNIGESTTDVACLLPGLGELHGMPCNSIRSAVSGPSVLRVVDSMTRSAPRLPKSS